jgi:hypothetical protein
VLDGSVGQTWPHAPQLDASTVSFTHAPAQYVVGERHTELHIPAEHTVPAVQAWPHVPQSEFVVVGVSHPLAVLPSQLPHPVMHMPMPHAPPVHDARAFGTLHTLPQPPHAVGVVIRFVSQPLPALPSQSPKPGEHRALHIPIVHTAVCAAPAGHA